MYRTALVSKHWCGGCAVFVFAESNVALLRLALSQSHPVKRVKASCPICRKRLGRWLVSHGDRMLELEACWDCGLVVLDSDELGAAAALLGEALPDLVGL